MSLIWFRLNKLHYPCNDVYILLCTKPSAGLVQVTSWWRHQMETFSMLLALCAGNSSVTGEFPAGRPVTRSFGVFFDVHLNKQLSKQSRRRWYETPSHSLYRHSNVTPVYILQASFRRSGRSYDCFSVYLATLKNIWERNGINPVISIKHSRQSKKC